MLIKGRLFRLLDRYTQPTGLWRHICAQTGQSVQLYGQQFGSRRVRHILAPGSATAGQVLEADTAGLLV